MSARFKVSVVTGYSGMNNSGDARPGLTAHVLDTWEAHKVVAVVRSEDRYEGGGNRTLGQDRARQAAEAKCAELNALPLAHA